MCLSFDVIVSKHKMIADIWILQSARLGVVINLSIDEGLVPVLPTISNTNALSQETIGLKSILWQLNLLFVLKNVDSFRLRLIEIKLTYYILYYDNIDSLDDLFIYLSNFI